MRFIYNIGIRVYQLGIFIASFFNEKASKLRKGQLAAFSVLRAKINPNEEYIWFHAASLGEFEQGRPVMERIKQDHPESRILLTFFSPSGYEIRKNYPLADVICYLPLDTRANAKRFVKTVNISKAIFIKYEFWPNYIQSLKKAGVPAISISAIFRPKQIFFRSYGRWYLHLLKTFAYIFVQDASSYQLLEERGFSNISVAGDTRFDRVNDLAAQAKKIPLVEEFVKGAKKVIVAGSSWPADEELLAKYLTSHPEIKLILVPHEIHEGHILNIENLVGGKCVRFTTADNTTIKQNNCLIVNTIGLLSSIYQYAHVTYIGGGFGVGIHNTLEAAVWNVPVVFGPNYQKFREARELIALGGAFSISEYNELETLLNRLLTDNTAGQKAGNYVRENAGATDLIISSLISKPIS